MRTLQSQWETLRRIADELGLKVHLAGMDARDRWTALQPRIHELEKAIATAGKPIGEAIDRELASLSRAVERLRDDLEDTDD
jgi:hypothetical protein